MFPFNELLDKIHFFIWIATETVGTSYVRIQSK